MSDVESGKILVADHQGTYMIKMSGDVRLTLCMAFDECIETLFSRSDFETVMFDLSQADNLDSTTLGLIAKVGVKCASEKISRPVVYCVNPAVIRLLGTMGIDEVCDITDRIPADIQTAPQYQDLENCQSAENEELVKNKILESHHVLMELNDKNRQTFKDLVNTLKCC